MDNRFEVTAGAGTMRSAADRVVSFPHRWTPEGVTVDADFTGGHLLHLAAAGCVLNDVYREAAALGLELTGSGCRRRAVSTPAPGRRRASPIQSISVPLHPGQ